MIKKILLISLFLLIVPLAAADFSVVVQERTQATCPTHFVSYPLSIVNTGEVSEAYTITKSGSAAKWAIISPSGFVLGPGESETVVVYITPPADAQVGSYDLEVFVSGKKDTQSVSLSVDVNECHGVDLSSIETEQKVCAGEIASYILTLKNEGIWTENYKLSVSGEASDWVSLSHEIVRLDPGQSEQITAFVKTPEDKVGEFEFTISARSLDSDAVKNIKFKIITEGCYGFELRTEKTYYSLCENTQLLIPITIRNTGSSADSYNLEVDGPEWVNLENTNFFISGEDQAQTNLVVYPKYRVAGNFPIQITATSENGKQTAALRLSVDVLTCHRVSVEIGGKTEDKLCPMTTQSYPVSIMNSGNFTEKFALKVSGAEWAELSENFLELAPGESQEVSLIVSPPSDTLPWTYDIRISAESQETEQVSDSDIIKITIAPPNSCFGVKTTAELNSIDVAFGEGALIPIVVENLGSEPTTYDLDVSGTAASFVQLNPSSVELGGHSAKTVYLYIAAPAQTKLGSYTAIVSARQKDGAISSSSVITINVVEKANKTSSTPLISNISKNKTTGLGVITGWFEGVKKSFSKIKFPEVSWREISLPKVGAPKVSSIAIGGFKTYLFNYWYIGVGIAVAIVIIAIIIIWKSGFFVIEEKIVVEKEKKKKPKKEKSFWEKFKEWFEEEEEIEIEVKKPKKSKAARKKKEKSLWERFKDWLEEE